MEEEPVCFTLIHVFFSNDHSQIPDMELISQMYVTLIGTQTHSPGLSATLWDGMCHMLKYPNTLRAA